MRTLEEIEEFISEQLGHYYKARDGETGRFKEQYSGAISALTRLQDFIEDGWDDDQRKYHLMKREAIGLDGVRP